MFVKEKEAEKICREIQQTTFPNTPCVSLAFYLRILGIVGFLALLVVSIVDFKLNGFSQMTISGALFALCWLLLALCSQLQFQRQKERYILHSLLNDKKTGTPDISDVPEQN